MADQKPTRNFGDLGEKIDVDGICNILHERGLLHDIPSSLEEKVEQLIDFIGSTDTSQFIELIDAVAETDRNDLAVEMRRMLNPTHFQWQWIEDGKVLAKSDHHQHPTDLVCRIDARKNMHLLPTDNHASLRIIAYTSADKVIGTVREETDMGTQTAPEKRKIPVPTDQKTEQMAEQRRNFVNLDKNIDIEGVCKFLHEKGLLHDSPPSIEEKAEQLVEFIRNTDIAEYIELTNALVETDRNDLAVEMRRMLNPTHFKWQWALAGQVLLESEHHQHATELSCRIDARKNMHLLPGYSYVALRIIAYTTDGEAIGTVREEMTVTPSTAAVPPKKRKTPVPADLPLQKRKMPAGERKYELKLTEELGDDTCMQVFLQDGRYSIDLRKWSRDQEDAELKPTKKGIRLPLQRFVRLLWKQDEVQRCLDRMKAGEQINEKLLIGGPVSLKMDSPFWTVHIREYYADGDDIKPGRNGIILKLGQWQKILKIGKNMDKVIPDFFSLKPCCYDEDHMNQEGMMACSECSYFRDFE